MKAYYENSDIMFQDKNVDVMFQDSNMGELRIVCLRLPPLNFQMDLRMLQRKFPNRRFWGNRPGSGKLWDTLTIYMYIYIKPLVSHNLMVSM